LLSASAASDAVPAFATVDSIEARVQGCVTCHGQRGQGTAYFPRIAGKPAGYLYHQLAAFRDGTRRYAPMNYLVAYLPDPYLQEIATWFSQQHPPYATPSLEPVDAATLERGHVIATHGDAGKGIPACTACHGDALTGMTPGIPGLAGLRPTYIVSQLTRWKVGERHAADPDCMKRVASRLSDTDVVAVANWLARQATPPETAPIASNLVRMPLACGSQP
jgi:cytochrome c553